MSDRPIKMVVRPKPMIVDDEDWEESIVKYKQQFSLWQRFKIFFGMMQVVYNWEKKEWEYIE